MAFWKEFKAFAFKGNVVDLAVAVIIGGAFGKIVTALVDDIIMPVIGKLTPNGQKFTDMYYVLTPGKTGNAYKSLAEAKTDGANVLGYGHFIQTIVDFLIIAFFIFLAIRMLAKMQKAKDEAPTAPPEPSNSEKLLVEIRDELRRQNTGM